jgi:hypothetical protein
MVHNGDIVIDDQRPPMVTDLGDSIPSSWFGPRTVLTYSGTLAMKKGGLQGSFADFNIWDSLLPREQMDDFTKC